MQQVRKVRVFGGDALDLSRRSVLAPRPHERERQSLEQLALIRQLLVARGLSLTDAMFLATQLVHHGFFEAEAVLSTLLREVPQASARHYFARLQKRHAVIQSLPALKTVFADKPRMAELYDPAKSVFFIPGSFRADTAVVVFTTINNNFGFSNAVLDAVLEQLGVSRLYLRDITRFVYFRGVDTLCNSLLDLPASVASLLAAKGIRNTVVTGFSSGGFPALYTAAVLDASACLAFSGYTDISLGSTIPQPRMFSNICDEIDISMRVNTRDVIAASRVAPGAFRLFYGLDHPIDRAHAEQLADLPQVRLVGLNDCSHYATPTLMERGEFVAAFADALAAVPISAEARND